MSKILVRSSLPGMESNGMERQCAEGMGAVSIGKFRGSDWYAWRSHSIK